MYHRYIWHSRMSTPKPCKKPAGRWRHVLEAIRFGAARIARFRLDRHFGGWRNDRLDSPEWRRRQRVDRPRGNLERLIPHLFRHAACHCGSGEPHEVLCARQGHVAPGHEFGRRPNLRDAVHSIGEYWRKAATGFCARRQGPKGTFGSPVQARCTTRQGATPIKVTTLQSIDSIGFGKSATDGGYPALYVIGQVAGVKAIYRSDDMAATWVKINDDQHQYSTSYVVTSHSIPPPSGRFFSQ